MVCGKKVGLGVNLWSETGREGDRRGKRMEGKGMWERWRKREKGGGIRKE